MLNRRHFLATTSLAAGLSTAPQAFAETKATPSAKPFRYCLNTSTIRGQKIPLVDEVKIASEAGYDGIEPWINEIDTYVKEGGSLPDLNKRIADAGLTVESAIGFAAFLVDDPAQRQKGLDEARRCMRLVKAIGGSRIAAPPVGVTDRTGMDLDVLAERFAALVQVGREEGVWPQLELWGFSKTLHKLGEVAYLLAQCGDVNALALLDAYHIYKGGSAFGGLGAFAGSRMKCFHINDYPADPPFETIKDEHRVYPGDGVCPLTELLTMLKTSGFEGTLSLELFNKSYWQQPAAEVAKTGLEKVKAVVAKAGL
ncbi:MAG: xylose isomerase [Planctomyces sp.]|nr:xylose isomerase [Planctomyces sp.]